MRYEGRIAESEVIGVDSMTISSKDFRLYLHQLYINFCPTSTNPAEVDREFYELLKTQYAEFKHNQESIGIFITAGGLLTYGHLEVVPDILDNIPDTRGQVKRLAWTVVNLLPVTRDIDYFPYPGTTEIWYDNARTLKQWFIENQSKLVWDEELLQFKFR
jgi:hypothetical protein